MNTPLNKKSTTSDIEKRFNNDVERFSNIDAGQVTTIDASLSMELITEAAISTTPVILKVLDIGCGGGLLSEPMYRLGANVVGIDASQKNIDIAKFHAKKNKLKINYICASPETLKIKKNLM